jgi:hypothetical protein
MKPELEHFAEPLIWADTKVHSVAFAAPFILAVPHANGHCFTGTESPRLLCISIGSWFSRLALNKRVIDRAKWSRKWRCLSTCRSSGHCLVHSLYPCSTPLFLLSTKEALRSNNRIIHPLVRWNLLSCCQMIDFCGRAMRLKLVHAQPLMQSNQCSLYLF